MISYKLPYDNVYTVYVKVRYNVDSFFMVGNQFGFVFDSNSSLNGLFDNINDRLSDYFSYYNLEDDDIVYIQISFRLLDRKVYSGLSIDKTNLSYTSSTKTEQKNVVDIASIPTTTEENVLGKPLEVVIDSNDSISCINLLVDGKTTNFLNNILEMSKYIRKNHKDVFSTFDSKYKFYFVKSNINYVLAIKDLGYKVEKLKFSTTGVLIRKIVDSNQNNILVRTQGNNSLIIENNNIIQSKQLIKFNCLEKYKVKDVSWKPNDNIGVIDIETSLADDGVNKVYSLGFMTKLSNKPIIYYIDKDLNSDRLVLELIDELLRSKYSDFMFII